MKTLTLRISEIVFLLLLVWNLSAQVADNAVLMTVGGKAVTVGEFLSIYQKNNVKNEALDRKSMDEYLELFINFKLKVMQAEELGIDTTQAFIKELQGYREQLAKPYFIDEATLDRLMHEAWDREKSDLRASHIYFRCKPDALPADTLAAFTKAIAAREKVLNGQPFESVVMEYSEDPSAKDREATREHPFMRGNKGDLGYFTVFDMVYPFETTAYNTNVGQASNPVRTDYGYHIIRVTDRMTALGDFTVAHLFLGIPKGAKASDSARIKSRIDSLYNLLKGGAKFEDLVKQFSDDKGSAGKGGLLPKRGVSRLMPEFIVAVASIPEVGGYSAPVLTQGYGWHIVKLVDRKPVGTFDEEKADLKQKVTKDSRAAQIHAATVARIKTEYNFTENLAARDEFYGLVTDSIFIGKWDPSKALELKQSMFRIGEMNHYQNEFAEFLNSKQKKYEKKEIHAFVNQVYNEFVDECVIRYENNLLEVKYPEFRNLMREYRDGIMLFDLTDQNVWAKAVKDSAGLENFYQNNKQNYMWGQRVDASIYTVKKPEAVSKIKNFIKSGLGEEAILKEVNTDTAKILSIESGKFSRKDNHLVDTVPWIVGISKDIRLKEAVVFVHIKRIIKPEPKKLGEAKGLITADYQNYLEKEWIRKLRQKYPVVINRDVYAKIK